MSRLIRFCLNHISRSWLQRLSGRLLPLAGWFLRGRGVECPVCGGRFRRFLSYGYVTMRRNALCPNCLALERHRLLWLWLQRESGLFRGTPRVLHIAPEASLERRLKRHFAAAPDRYVTADLCSPLADLHFDVQSIPIADGAFDVLICNHLLEHVEDDRQALREFYRILRTGGWGVLLSPVELDRPQTFEDPAVTDPAERTRLFGQYDHRRVYGSDYADRLREAGFAVEDLDYAARLGAETCARYALPGDHIYIVRK